MVHAQRRAYRMQAVLCLSRHGLSGLPSCLFLAPAMLLFCGVLLKSCVRQVPAYLNCVSHIDENFACRDPTILAFVNGHPFARERIGIFDVPPHHVALIGSPDSPIWPLPSEPPLALTAPPAIHQTDCDPNHPNTVNHAAKIVREAAQLQLHVPQASAGVGSHRSSNSSHATAASSSVASVHDSPRASPTHIAVAASSFSPFPATQHHPRNAVVQSRLSLDASIMRSAAFANPAVRSFAPSFFESSNTVLPTISHPSAYPQTLYPHLRSLNPSGYS